MLHPSFFNKKFSEVLKVHKHVCETPERTFTNEFPVEKNERMFVMHNVDCDTTVVQFMVNSEVLS